MQRILFLIFVYSGMRALFNRLFGLFLPSPTATSICGRKIRLDELGIAHVRVHPRKTPKLCDGKVAGMVSVFLESPGVRDWVYRLVLWTSHFGVGHLEIAFYESRDFIVIYAIRNQVQANLARIGREGVLQSLKLTRLKEETLVLQEVVSLLESCGFQCRFASPEDCVKLAVTPDLLKTSRRNDVLESIRRNYERKIKGVVTSESPIDREPRKRNTK